MILASGVAAKGLSVALSGLAGTTKVLKAVGVAARLMWVGITGPIGLVIGAAALALMVAWKPVSTFFKGLWKSISSAFGSSEIDEFSGTVTDAPGRISESLGKLKKALGPIGDFIVGVFKKIGDAWKGMKAFFSGDQTKAGEDFGKSMIDRIANVIDKITELVNWLKTLTLLDIFLPFRLDPKLAGDSLLTGFKEAWKTVTDWWDKLSLADVGKNLIKTLFAADNMAGGNLLKGFKDSWKFVTDWWDGLSLVDAGKNLMKTLGQGIIDAKDELKNKMKESLGVVGRLFNFSDAKEGPLSRVTEAGENLIKTFAQGIRNAEPIRIALMAGALALPSIDTISSPILDAISSGDLSLPAIDTIAPPLPVGPVPTASAPAGASTSFSISFENGAIQINAEGGDAHQIAGAVGNELAERMRTLTEQT